MADEVTINLNVVGSKSEEQSEPDPPSELTPDPPPPPVIQTVVLPVPPPLENQQPILEEVVERCELLESRLATVESTIEEITEVVDETPASGPVTLVEPVIPAPAAKTPENPDDITPLAPEKLPDQPSPEAETNRKPFRWLLDILH